MIGKSKKSRVIHIYIAFLQTQMPVCKLSRLPSARSTHYESFLYKERFVYLFQCALILAYYRSYNVGSDRTTLELCDDRLKYLIVNGIQSPLVNIQGIKGITRDAEVDAAVSHHLGEVAHAAKERIGDTRSTAASERDLIRRILIYAYLQYIGASLHDACQRHGIVILHGAGDSETGSQRGSKQTAACCSSDQRERIE